MVGVPRPVLDRRGASRRRVRPRKSLKTQGKPATGCYRGGLKKGSQPVDIPNSVLDQPRAPDRENAFSAIDAALSLAEDGWAVFPMSRHKTPLKGSRGVRDASCDPCRIREMFGRPGVALVAIATGTPSGISVLDVDRQHGGLDWLRENLKRLPETLAWRTRSGGVHLIFLHRPELRTTPLGKIGTGIEIRASGASAIYWPAQGFEYLCAGPIAPFPDWLLPPPRPAYAPPPPRVPDNRQVAALIRVAATAPESRRNAALFWSACRMAPLVVSRLLSHGEAEALLVEAASRAGLPAAESRATARSGLRTGGAA